MKHDLGTRPCIEDQVEEKVKQKRILPVPKIDLAGIKANLSPVLGFLRVERVIEAAKANTLINSDGSRLLPSDVQRNTVLLLGEQIALINILSAHE